MLKIQILNRSQIEKFITDKKHIVISIRNPEEKPVKLPIQKSRLASLFLDFHDADNRSLKLVDSDIKLKLFNEEQATSILEFVELFKDKIQLVVVNCEAGISRSAGIGASLSKIYNNDDTYFFKHYCPNMLVYKKILATYYDNKRKQTNE